MSPDDPRHGTNAGAIQHWRDGETPCPPCATAARRTRKAARLDALNGRERRVPLGNRAWNIVRTVPRNQLSHQTGIASDKLLRYETGGPDMTVLRTTRDRLLAGRSEWTAIGIQRRLQALSRQGWSMRVVADLADVDMDGLKRLRRRDPIVFVRRYIAEAVVDVYDQLEMALPEDGPSSRKTRVDAAARGWLPPLAWTDIDDPDEQPNDWEYRKSNRADAIKDLDSTKAGISQACRQLKITREALQQWCSRNDMSDLYHRLVTREEYTPNGTIGAA